MDMDIGLRFLFFLDSLLGIHHVELTQTSEHLDQELDLVFDALDVDVGPVTEVHSLVFEDLHVLELVVLLQLIQLVIVLLKKVEQLAVVFLSLLHVDVPSGEGILEQLDLGAQVRQVELALNL
eukprot:CAMPEP_0170511686 /NCGR_PEP_ID=MMETSP0208-20121228/66440_1 /TAXON_ID=197538 /ORGANISM="Strombidium inclinatum, Strain S3" /LENGTH=122 /DNA_ID=CAMNT_0010795247 /DNA_START=275 /DNA_END=644 /DNA_ORIENTATION=+